VRFAVEECGSFMLDYLAWTSAHFVNVGDNVNTGVAVTYNGGCNASPLLIGTISYFAHGDTPPCAYLRVIPDPSAVSGRIEGADCSLNKTFPEGWPLAVNSDGTCSCGAVLGGGGPIMPPCNPVPTEETSWGKVKALYR